MFRTPLIDLTNVELRTSTSYHPQTDGRSEIMNSMIENYLLRYCSLNQNGCDMLLPSAELPFNSSWLETTGYTSFDLEIGWTLASPLDNVGLKQAKEVLCIHQLRDLFSSLLKNAHFTQKLAQARQNAYNFQKCPPDAYQVGDHVWRNKWYISRTRFISFKHRKILSVKRFGPFPMTELIGKNKVRLHFLSSARGHDFVHAEHTRPYYPQPVDIALPRASPAKI